MRTCEHANMRTCEHANLRTCEHVNMRTCEHANMRTCEHANMRTCEHANLRTCEHANMRTCEHPCDTHIFLIVACRSCLLLLSVCSFSFFAFCSLMLCLGVQPKTRKDLCVVRTVLGSEISPLKGKGEGSNQKPANIVV